MTKIMLVRLIKCLEKLAANGIAGEFGERLNKYAHKQRQRQPHKKKSINSRLTWIKQGNKIVPTT